MRQKLDISSPDLSYGREKENTCGFNVDWMVRVWQKLNQWVRLSVLLVMNSFKPIMNTQLFRLKRGIRPKSDWDLVCADLAELAGNKKFFK